MLIYPERRWIGEAGVLAWAADLFEGRAPRYRCCACGAVTVARAHGRLLAELRPGEYAADDPAHPCDCAADSEAIHDGDQHRPIGLVECLDYLEDLGVASFRRARVACE